VTDVGRVNDRSFNQSAWEGVVQAGTALGLTEGDGFKYIETQDSKDYADNIQQFVDAGFNVIVTVGFALGEATTAAPPKTPTSISSASTSSRASAAQPDRPGLPRRSVGLPGRARWPRS
jgi:basic membrane lipoprotein Med (substrate-binding protein (PBP1-ABC) superfamily)